MDSPRLGNGEGVWLDGLTSSGEMVQALRSVYATKKIVLLDGPEKKTVINLNYDGRILKHGFKASRSALWTLLSNDTVVVVDFETKGSQVYDPMPRQALRSANVDFEEKRIAAVTFRKLVIYSFGESLTLVAAMKLEREPCDVLIHGQHVVVEFSPTFDRRRTLACYQLGGGKLVEVWQVNLEEQVNVLSALAFQNGPPTSKGEFVIRGGVSGLTLVSMQGGKASSITGDEGRVEYSGFSPDGNTLVTASASRLLVRERGPNGFNQPIVDV